MNKNYVWCDRNYNYYTLEDIDDRYLLNILKFISNGGGYVYNINANNIRSLYEEASRRNLKHNYDLRDLLLAYYQKKYGD